MVNFFVITIHLSFIIYLPIKQPHKKRILVLADVVKQQQQQQQQQQQTTGK